MKGSTQQNLIDARTNFRRCAKKLEERRIGDQPLGPTDREMQIGFGLCADWQRWAASLDDLRFSSKVEQRSSRTVGLTESTRFNCMWTGTNALFARDSILSLAKQPAPLPPLGGEESRFRLLYEFAQIPAPIAEAEQTLLNQLLRMECEAESLAGAPNKPSYMMWEIIFYKYIVAHQQTLGIGHRIATALASGACPYLDAPAIIYGARNWNVHGVLLSSSFRGTRRKYVAFMNSIMLLLSEVLARSAIEFNARL
jgi:hypothetical protein